MTRRKDSNIHGNSSNGSGSVINALRKLYDPVLDEPIPQFLIDAAFMTREQAEAAERADAPESPTGPAADQSEKTAIDKP